RMRLRSFCGREPLRRGRAGATAQPHTMSPWNEATESTMDRIPDIDPQETREWLDALHGVLPAEGPDGSLFLIEQLIDKARRSGAYLPFSANTAYINTIPLERQVRIPGDQNLEHRMRSLAR